MPKIIPVAGLLISACCGVFGQAPAARAEFEVASIKPSQLSNAGGERIRRESVTADPGNLMMRNVSLKSALQWAYGMKDYQVSGPGWLGDERYDIIAKAGPTADEQQLRKMLQVLLTDRFKMTIHRETKILSAYALVVDKNGLKMRAGDPAGKSSIQPAAGSSGLRAAVTNMSMDEIADLLSNGGPKILNLSEPVVDQTGLKGRFNFTIDAEAFMQKFSEAAAAGRPDPDFVINAVQEVLQSQLGLKAELRKAPVDLIVVDRADKVPVEN